MMAKRCEKDTWGDRAPSLHREETEAGGGESFALGVEVSLSCSPTSPGSQSFTSLSRVQYLIGSFSLVHIMKGRPNWSRRTAVG
jgi:hypothetical protein